jgi:splicing factor 3B subunit 3
MHIYNLTLQRATAITHAIFGNFSAPKAQEIVVARGKVLELLRPNDFNGKVQTVLSVEVFGTIRSIVPFRLTGDTRDYIIVGSDSGRIVILQYNNERNTFDKIHQETFGKSGCRRIVPGQYLAVDPKGRAVMIGAVEKQKLVYILNRDSAARLTISSPLEAHKSHTINIHMVGVDVGFENPIFATLEVDYADVDHDPTGKEFEALHKNLTFYELDLGLNHVVRKWSEPVDITANMLVAVPGGSDGPGGVLVMGENFVVWKNQGHQEVRAALPRRKILGEERSVLIVSATAHKQKDLFFILLQSEYGDIYKATLAWEEDNVSAIKINYFDTVPTSNAMCILKTGFLFVAAEFGNHFLFQFQSIGDEEEESTMDQDEDEIPTFDPQPLKNLIAIDEIESLAPIMDFKVADMVKEETKQFLTLCGRGPRSSLRLLKHGLAVAEMADSPLPGNPNNIFTVRKNVADEYDSYIIVSFLNATLVLSIGDNVEEVKDAGFNENASTLNVGLVGDDSLVQVFPTGIRFIRSDKRITEWPTPARRTIVRSAINNKQVVIALTGGELLYFELDITGSLVEVGRKDMGRDIACIDIAPIPEGRLRARFLAVGDYENTVRVLSLDPEDVFSSLAVQALPAPPESLCIVKMKGGTDSSAGTLFLNIGLTNGVLQRTVLDKVTGELSDTRTRFLGSRPVRLLKLRVGDQPAMLALTSRTWLCYNYQLHLHLTPLSYSALDYASNFCSERCPEGMVATIGNALRIISPERLGEVFHQELIPLRYTPRKMLVYPTTGNLITIETDHNTYPALIQGGLRQRLLEAQQEPSAAAADGDSGAVKKEKEEEMETEDGEKTKEAKMGKLEELQREQAEREESARVFGTEKPGVGKWASCVRLLDVNTKQTIDVVELDNNEAAFSACTCVFHDRGGEIFLVVGTAKGLVLNPRSCDAGYIHVYRLLDGGKRFSLVHKTQVEGVPTAVCGFQGRLLVGIGKMLRIYDLGKRKLLRKCENKGFPHCIQSITTQGERIIVGDLAESFHFVKYRKAENQLNVYADDSNPRWLTASQMLDYDTMAGADKFGNVFIVRLPSEVNEELEDNPMGNFLMSKQSLNGAAFKLQTLINFHVGDTINSMTKASLFTGGADVLVYTTLMGGMGALLPFVSREDVDFFSHLEMHMRSELPPLCGRDHLAYRSYYFPVKDVIDGDLCEQFSLLPPEKQRTIAEELDRTPGEVLKKLEVIRNSIL